MDSLIQHTEKAWVASGDEANWEKVEKNKGQTYTFQMRRLKPARWWECESPTVKV